MGYGSTDESYFELEKGDHEDDDVIDTFSLVPVLKTWKSNGCRSPRHLHGRCVS